MHRIEMGEVTEAFAACWQAAGVHLQEEGERAGLHLMWLKANLEPPFLEHLSFCLGNQLFFVRLEDANGAVQGPGSVAGLLAIERSHQKPSATQGEAFLLGGRIEIAQAPPSNRQLSCSDY